MIVDFLESFLAAAVAEVDVSWAADAARAGCEGIGGLTFLARRVGFEIVVQCRATHLGRERLIAQMSADIPVDEEDKMRIARRIAVVMRHKVDQRGF